MKKRILGTTLLLCFLFSCMFSFTAFATESKHFHPRVSFETPLSAALPSGVQGSYYLTADVKADADIIVDKEVSLCLNGFSMDMGAYSIKVSPEGSLTLYDCPESMSGSIISDAVSQEAMIQNSGDFVIYSGVYNSKNRPVLFNRATATVAGGYITGSNADLIESIGSAMLSLNGGTIEAFNNASAVVMLADPVDETAGKKDYNVGIGGACVVSAQTDSRGTLVVDAPRGRFVINTGADIRGFGCPAVNVLSGSFDAYGAAVVYADTESAIVGTGGNVSLYNAVISSDEKYGVDISENAELLLSGSLDILGGMASVHLAEGKLFSMSDYGFYGNVVLSIHTESNPTEGGDIAISTPCDKKHAPHFISSNPGCTIVYENGVIYNKYDGGISHYHEGRNYILPLDRGSSDLTKNNFYLEEDMNRSGFFTGSMVNICLNGHTLNLSSAIKMYPGSTLNIFDCVGGGKIEANSSVIQDINNGDVKIVLHDGILISHGASVVKLSGGDSLIVKNGTLQSEYEGSCAVEVTGIGNSVEVQSGEINGFASGIRMQDAQLNVSGEGSIKGGLYAIDCTGFKEGSLTLEGAPVLSGETADIHLAANMHITAQNGFSPAEKVSIASDTAGDYVALSAAGDSSYAEFFESADGVREIVCGVDNALVLTNPLNITPESAELMPSSTVTFNVSYTGDSAQPLYQWYIRNLADMETKSLDGASDTEYTASSDMGSGDYELFCTVADELGQYISRPARLTVAKDAIENVSVSQLAELSYTGAEITPELEASGSTKFGKPVSFVYSLDNMNYSGSIPAIGPEPGEYSIYYTASAEGCEDLQGQLKVIISAETEDSTEDEPEGKQKFNIDIRFIAIIALVFIELIVCSIYLILKVRKEK